MFYTRTTFTREDLSRYVSRGNKKTVFPVVIFPYNILYWAVRVGGCWPQLVLAVFCFYVRMNFVCIKAYKSTIPSLRNEIKCLNLSLKPPSSETILVTLCKYLSHKSDQ